ncbi:hypothetical protein amrb99_68340 [Actinomadura sp. RB99]|uniref:hypothetical protein n=1 Tax=Actinomadura sp. RB99 TaxID=2691577 RepID=UPI00199BC97E|nr:hypothetical protein [Actinomadura sp. RB99]MBD2897867.1 hypothetical protein [Actinomadura sp. RB99]
MTGPEALTMADAARYIAEAVGTPVRYVDVPFEDKEQAWLATGYPPPRATAFLQLFRERRRLGRSSVDHSTHERFGVEPATVAQFARRYADVFRGDAADTVTPGLVANGGKR